MMMLHRYIVFISSLVVAYTSPTTERPDDPLISPCPDFFTYERTEFDRWYGVATLVSYEQSREVRLRLTFDRHILQIGNWFGEIARLPNDDYVIRNDTFPLKQHQRYTLRFFVKYDRNMGPAPQLIRLELNDRTICPEADSIYTTPPTNTDAIPLGDETLDELNATNVEFTSESSGDNRKNWNNIDASRWADDNAYVGDFGILHHPERGPGEEFKCGTRVVQPANPSLKTYGHLTRQGEFPWHAALYFVTRRYMCGATLITAEHVITAAHCVTRRNSRTPISAYRLNVYLGKYHLLEPNHDVSVQKRSVTKVHVHPLYAPGYFSNDIAIVKLDEPVIITDYVRPVCVVREYRLDDPVRSEKNKFSGIVAGWGFDENGRVLNKLMQTKMLIPDSCQDKFMGLFFKYPLSAQTYCAGFPNGTAVCNADSGSGMVFETWDETRMRRHFQLRGVVSVSVALQKNVKCSESHYTIFTDVNEYIDWISKVLQPIS